jgi:hypothetical protein
VLLVTVETDDDQELAVARWRRLRFGRIVAEGLVVPDDISADDLAAVHAYAVAHPAAGRFARGAKRLRVDRLSDWCETVLRPAVVASSRPAGHPHKSAWLTGHTWLVGWDMPWVLSRLCRAWAPAIADMYGGWGLKFFDNPAEPGEATGNPYVRVRQFAEDAAVLRWSRPPAKGGGKREDRLGEPNRVPRPGAIIDERHLLNVLGGRGIAGFADACAEFEVPRPDEGGDVLDRLASTVDALHGLHVATLRELDVWNAGGLSLDPRRLYTGGSAATGVLRAMGVAPLAARALPDEVVGALAGAGHGGRTEANLLGVLFPAAHLDVKSSYVTLARLIGASDVVLAEGYEVIDATNQLAEWLAELQAAPDPVEVLLDPAVWKRWAFTVALVRPDLTWLPYRKLLRSGEYLSAFGPLSHDGALPYMALDFAAAVIAGGEAPVVERAWTVRPIGRAGGLRDVRLPGGVRFDPNDRGADLYTAVLASRDAASTDRSATQIARRRREAAIKGLGVSLAYGCFGRVDRKPIAEPREVECIGPWGERLRATVRGVVEEPGPDYCPLLASAVTAAGRLTMALIERLVTDVGGVVAQVLTDAVTVPAAAGGGWAWTPDGGVPLLDFSTLRAICERLVPLEITLRPQHGTLDEFTEAYIVGTNRYVLARDGGIVHASEFALGGIYLDATGQGDRRVAPSGARGWVVDAMQAAVVADRGAPVEVAFGDMWAVSPFSASSPRLAKWLGGDAVRAFTRGLTVHVDPGFEGTVAAEPEPGGPVVVAPHTTPPSEWPALGWRSRTGQPRRPVPPTHQPGYVVGPDRFVPKTMDTVVNEWRLPRAPQGQVDRRPAVALDDVHLIGKEGDLLLERQRSITAVEDAVTVYDTGSGGGTAWALAVAVLEHLGPTAAAQVAPELSQDTRWGMRNGRSPRARTRAVVIARLRLMAVRALGQVDPDASTEGLLAAFLAHLDANPRRCKSCEAPLPPERERWCDEACRSRARRVAARLEPVPVVPKGTAR